MQNAILLAQAVVLLQAQEKQAPSTNAEMMFERTKSAVASRLEEADYFYLSLFVLALSEAKKLSTADDLPFEHLGLFAHALNESSSKVS